MYAKYLLNGGVTINMSCHLDLGLPVGRLCQTQAFKIYTIIVIFTKTKFTLVTRRGWVPEQETPKQKTPTVPSRMQMITGFTIIYHKTAKIAIGTLRRDADFDMFAAR